MGCSHIRDVCLLTDALQETPTPISATPTQPQPIEHPQFRETEVINGLTFDEQSLESARRLLISGDIAFLPFDTQIAMFVPKQISSMVTVD